MHGINDRGKRVGDECPAVANSGRDVCGGERVAEVPAYSMETTLDGIAFDAYMFDMPSDLIICKRLGKRGWKTTPPGNAIVLAEEDDAPIGDKCEPWAKA
jgi:hypothetical protein